MRRLLFAAIGVTAIILVIGAVLQLGQKAVDLHSGSSPYTAKPKFLVEHDGKYEIAYNLHNCEGTELILANVTVGGLAEPHQFHLATATRADETGVITLPLYYSDWQVVELGKSADCTWTMSVRSVLF